MRWRFVENLLSSSTEISVSVAADDSSMFNFPQQKSTYSPTFDCRIVLVEIYDSAVV